MEEKKLLNKYYFCFLCAQKVFLLLHKTEPDDYFNDVFPSFRGLECDSPVAVYAG